MIMMMIMAKIDERMNALWSWGCCPLTSPPSPQLSLPLGKNLHAGHPRERSMSTMRASATPSTVLTPRLGPSETSCATGGMASCPQLSPSSPPKTLTSPPLPCPVMSSFAFFGRIPELHTHSPQDSRAHGSAASLAEKAMQHHPSSLPSPPPTLLSLHLRPMSPRPNGLRFFRIRSFFNRQERWRGTATMGRCSSRGRPCGLKSRCRPAPLLALHVTAPSPRPGTVPGCMPEV
jgi:hypothetical protein